MKLFATIFVLVLGCLTATGQNKTLKFIGLETTASFQQTRDTQTNPNVYTYSISVMPEFGFRIGGDFFISLALGVSKTHWNYDYALANYNWLTLMSGVQVAKQFSLWENTSYFLGAEVRYSHQIYDLKANGQEDQSISKYMTYGLSNGLNFDVAKRFSIIPLLLLKYRSPIDNGNPDNNFQQISVMPTIRFRYILTKSNNEL